MPSSIELGTLNNPINPELNCTLKDISVGVDNIQACLCRLPFCNDLSLESNKRKNFESTGQGPTQNELFVEENDSSPEKPFSPFNSVGNVFN